VANPQVTSAPERLLMAGDWHRNADWALKVIDYASREGVDVIVHCGDFGFWVDDNQTRNYLDSMEKLLAEKRIALLWVDGNHEDHSRLNALPLDNGVRPISEHITHLPRGYRWEWHGQTWMALGGGHSVDRKWRTEGVNWWPEEHLSRVDVSRAADGGAVDVIVSHDCPSGVDIPGLIVDGWPPEDAEANDAHREVVAVVVDGTNPSTIFHGHYHVKYFGERPLPGGGTTRIVGLDCDGTTLIDNTLLINPRVRSPSAMPSQP
jgi:predicted phosphodiesterase